jgi:hypothetical protein
MCKRLLTELGYICILRGQVTGAASAHAKLRNDVIRSKNVTGLITYNDGGLNWRKSAWFREENAVSYCQNRLPAE